MGASSFHHLAAGADVDQAYSAACDHARSDDPFGSFAGTIATTSGFEVLPGTGILTEAEAYNLVDRMGFEGMSKHAPAKAIPVTTGKRTVTVSGFTYDSRTDLTAAVADKVTLRRGESIESASLRTYRQPTDRWGCATGMRTDCVAVVTIAAAPLERTEKVTVTFASTGSDDGNRAAARDLARQQVRLRKGERITITAASHGTAVVATKVTAVAPKGATSTRYAVLGLAGHATWATGFASQAAARAWATEAINDPKARTWNTPDEVEVIAVTRRADGSPLVSVRREVTKISVEVTVTIDTGRPRPSTPDAWLFFGMAPE
jgi:hypothetical protein